MSKSNGIALQLADGALIFARMNKKVRVRFAPSPTGGLHLGGVRTVLYNYLFARQHGGDFILRIEDTDQSRFVPGAEAYILDCLKWCGLEPDESVIHGGACGPYRQSERKEIYQRYAHQLVEDGAAYYAFDTPEELDQMREKNKTPENPSPTYNQHTRKYMRNSLNMGVEEARDLIASGVPYVVRICMPEQEAVELDDMIRGKVVFQTAQVDDKVLLKADGMPTYHLAVVVDDYLMQITHAFRGEEWLSSAPVHIMLWKKLGWEASMPVWAHLPLIMGPDGAKLSKRHGNKYGFPIFAMNWTDPVKNEFTEGFRERGFLPEAFINLLALMGWNDGSGQEIFTLDELISRFSLERVHSAPAQFDFEKAKWFNHEWIKRSSAERLLPDVKAVFNQKGIFPQQEGVLLRVIDLVKERCTLLSDFAGQASFFFVMPEHPELEGIRSKWNPEKQRFFNEWLLQLEWAVPWNAADLENGFKELAAAHQHKPGELMLPLRIMLVGGKFGPGVFDIAEIIGKDNTRERIRHTLSLI